MRGLVASTAVLGVLAIGGVPALAMTLASDEAEPRQEPATTLAEEPDEGRSGPPTWAQGRGPGENQGRDEGDSDDEGDDTGPPAWAQGPERQPPPGWARNHAGAKPYGWTVRAWAYCMSQAEADREAGESVRPRARCGEKPAKPAKAAKPAKPEKAAKPKADRSG